MTNHYNIEVIQTGTHFKATYRDKKFRKLEHLRGVLTKEMMREIGRIIPRNEDDISEFTQQHYLKVTYHRIATEKSLYTLFMEAWYRFYEDYTQLPPKFTGADGNALKAIITYLKQIGGSDGEALEAWKLILNKWGSLNDFHKANTDLKYINSKLNVIIKAIKHQNQTYAKGTGGSIQL